MSSPHRRRLPAQRGFLLFPGRRRRACPPRGMGVPPMSGVTETRAGCPRHPRNLQVLPHRLARERVGLAPRLEVAPGLPVLPQEQSRAQADLVLAERLVHLPAGIQQRRGSAPIPVQAQWRAPARTGNCEPFAVGLVLQVRSSLAMAPGRTQRPIPLAAWLRTGRARAQRLRPCTAGLKAGRRHGGFSS